MLAIGKSKQLIQTHANLSCNDSRHFANPPTPVTTYVEDNPFVNKHELIQSNATIKQDKCHWQPTNQPFD